MWVNHYSHPIEIILLKSLFLLNRKKMDIKYEPKTKTTADNSHESCGRIIPIEMEVQNVI